MFFSTVLTINEYNKIILILKSYFREANCTKTGPKFGKKTENIERHINNFRTVTSIATGYLGIKNE